MAKSKKAQGNGGNRPRITGGVGSAVSQVAGIAGAVSQAAGMGQGSGGGNKFPTPDQNRFIAQGAHDQYVAKWAKDNGYSLTPGKGLSVVNQLDYTLGGWTGSASMKSPDRGGGTTYFYGRPGAAAGGNGAGAGAGGGGNGAGGAGAGGAGGNAKNNGEYNSIMKLLGIQADAGRDEREQWQDMMVKDADENRLIAERMQAQSDDQASMLQGLMIQQQQGYNQQLQLQQQQNASAQAAALQQQQEASNMARAYVPDMQQTALSPGFGDSRRARSSRATSANTLSGLSILTNAGQSAGSLAGLQIA